MLFLIYNLVIVAQHMEICLGFYNENELILIYLQETRKILETSKEKLDITVSRDPYRSTFNKVNY